MRLKTFFAAYLLFLFILLSITGIVSVYMTNSQINMLRDKSIRDYRTISASLERDITVLHANSAGLFNLSEHEESLMRGYSRYYSQYNIEISVSEAEHADNTEITFIQREQKHFIHITGVMSAAYRLYRLDYYFDISDSLADIQNIQRVIIIFSVVFSVIAALGLYYILLRIFKPLGIVANTSRKISNGNYGERIYIKGENELSSMAMDFNRMAEQIEQQIHLLEGEALGKQQFIDNFAHEIRNPLTSVYGYAEYLQKTSFDEDITIKSTQFIMDEANHMKKIANSLLELATLRNYSPVKNKISIENLFNETKQTLKKSLHEKNIQFICKNEIETLDGQEDLIKSLILNLCFNAIKACVPNEGFIPLEAKMQNKKIVLSVSDNGCGISNEDIEKITEPFYRVDKARSREHGGAGLGLTLCKQIAEVHGAEMKIESAVGAGTKIKIFFTTP